MLCFGIKCNQTTDNSQQLKNKKNTEKIQLGSSEVNTYIVYRGEMEKKNKIQKNNTRNPSQNNKHTTVDEELLSGRCIFFSVSISIDLFIFFIS